MSTNKAVPQDFRQPLWKLVKDAEIYLSSTNPNQDNARVLVSAANAFPLKAALHAMPKAITEAVETIGIDNIKINPEPEEPAAHLSAKNGGHIALAGFLDDVMRLPLVAIALDQAPGATQQAKRLKGFLERSFKALSDAINRPALQLQLFKYYREIQKYLSSADSPILLPFKEAIRAPRDGFS